MKTSHFPQKVVSTLLLFGISQNCAAPVPAPLPGGVSQVGFTIYQNKEAAERARNPHKSSQADGLHSTHKNDRVIVTYSINHPTSYSQQEAVGDVSKTVPKYNLFQSHQQHQKHMEMIRLSQMQGSFKSNPSTNINTEYVSNLPSNKYKVQEQKADNYAAKSYQQQQQRDSFKSVSSPSSPSFQVKSQQEQRQEQSPYFPSTYDKIPSNHQHEYQHPVKDNNLNNIENLSLKEALDMSYPLQYF